MRPYLEGEQADLRRAGKILEGMLGGLQRTAPLKSLPIWAVSPVVHGIPGLTHGYPLRAHLKGLVSELSLVLLIEIDDQIDLKVLVA